MLDFLFESIDQVPATFRDLIPYTDFLMAEKVGAILLFARVLVRPDEETLFLKDGFRSVWIMSAYRVTDAKNVCQSIENRLPPLDWSGDIDAIWYRLAETGS